LPILLVGPTGTGKELFARLIHFLSGRAGQQVSVNCGALPCEMADSLLFGHRKGSFTGAAESHAGHFERANGGTLFLDELTSLSDLLQIKLLRALDDGVILPLGAIVERHLDIRVVAAAQEDIYEAVRVGSLRSDLFQRVAGVIVRLPALAERPEDIFPLAEHFARVGNRTLESGVEGV